jgi:hypothetical protein
VQVEALKVRGENEIRTDVCRVEGEVHARAAALWWMKLLGRGEGSDAGVDLAQSAPGVPHLNGYL